MSHAEHHTLPPAQDPAVNGLHAIEPPRTIGGILRNLGPGLIIAGSIVGSGELIATTKTGAQAGISLLWLILIGCLIKVFVQIELGRYTISHGETTLAALDRVPGPRLRVNWIVWCWVAMCVVGLGQLGGIVGGVGQSLAVSFPLRGDYADAIRMPAAGTLKSYLLWDTLLLNEWDVRRHLAWGSADGEEAPEPLTADQWQFVREKNRTTAEQLEQFRAADPQLARRLIEDVRSLSEFEARFRQAGVPAEDEDAADDPTAAEVSRRRTELRKAFEQANSILLSAAFEAGLDAKQHEVLFRRSEAARRRFVRGQVLLAQQLARLDEEDLRATEAAVAVAQLRIAEQELAAAQQALEAIADGGEDAELRRARKQVLLADAATRARQIIVDALVEPRTLDDKFWAAFAALFTMVLLFRGRYGLVQNVSIVLVVLFTFITIGNVIALESTERFAVSGADFVRGMSFGLPETILGERNPLATALATFGIIGVGASELISYPYWCLEKGYAKFTGPRSADENWVRRARGWMRVMQWDAFLSMIVYTIATLAFFITGVAVLHNEGLDPDGMRMVGTLARAYVPIFGESARWLFLIGAVAVLYSTFMVATASHARVYTDGFKVFGLMSRHNQRAHDRSVSALSVLVPVVCLGVYWSGINPVRAILLSGMMQALLLPMIGLGALYARYQRTDERLRPSPLWDACLIISCVGLLVAGAYGVYSHL
ncbi:MAG: Nramp family divalent metal transporter [Planctomycetes bacterium]|nr:Nramp family divalent metal transporter [Planctomycetota bacterium]